MASTPSLSSPRAPLPRSINKQYFVRNWPLPTDTRIDIHKHKHSLQRKEEKGKKKVALLPSRRKKAGSI
jgi:hypothetical protein